MKTNKPHNFLLLALTAVFSCCSGEDYSDITVSGTPSGETSTAPLTITVTDGGYASLSGGSSTRTSEVDYSTVFTAGDQIGVFAVKDNAIVEGVSNLCLTAHAASSASDAGNASPSTDTNAALTWLDGQSNAPNIQTGATYYAYYPYQSNLKIEDLDPTASNATSFFDGVITNWTPATNQSNHDSYTAQDLMIAKGTADGSNKSLSFSMSHQMALVVIDLPRNIKYSLSSGANTWTVIGDAPDTKFDYYTPYRMDNGMYRYLVKPSKEKFLISGSYANKDNKTTWVYDTQKIGTGNYKIIKVDGGSSATIEATYKPAVGDFYMKDGSLIAGSTASLTPAQQAACIGIVFWIGDATEEDKMLKSGHPDCTHGLVVALKDADGTMKWSKQFDVVQDWVKKDNTYNSVDVQNADEMCGYSNTLALEAYNKEKDDDNYRVLPCDAISGYSTKNPAPINSSGWYFPSFMELKYVCWGQGQGQGTTGRNILNTQIGKVSGGSRFVSEGYWSSTEFSLYGAWAVTFNDGKTYDRSKEYYSYRVRLLLAF